MNTTLCILVSAMYVICLVYMLLNFKRDIHIFQQNSYRPERYMRWLKKNFMPAWRLMDVALLFLLLSTLLKPLVTGVIVSIVLIVKMAVLLRAKYKKPLVFTKRVWRLYACVGILALAAVLPFCLQTYFDAGSIEEVSLTFRTAGTVILGLSVFSWAVMLLSAYIMTPVERHINNGFRKDAIKRLESMPDLKVIGITGSFGKTSTKHYLHRILSEKYDTLMTPGSFNTPMGVIRTVREMMKPYCEVFICEMGAKQKGDIREICDLVHPDYGILTAVGPQHLESFKTIENVRDTKFELIDSLPADGFAVINNDFPQIASREVANVECARYGVRDKKADYCADNIVYGEDGTDFVIIGDGRSIALHTPLVGECNVSNLIAAVVMALKLGVPEAKIRQAVARIAPVEHRLSMKRTAAGITIIDDAFNSNPSGSEMALDVLRNMKSGRRIVVTPGMIELGEQQYELNRQFGKLIARAADIAVIVGQYNRQAITEGIESEGNSGLQLIEAPTFKEAMAVLSPMLKRGDVVLLENDLPDTFK